MRTSGPSPVGRCVVAYAVGRCGPRLALPPAPPDVVLVNLSSTHDATPRHHCSGQRDRVHRRRPSTASETPTTTATMLTNQLKAGFGERSSEVTNNPITTMNQGTPASTKAPADPAPVLQRLALALIAIHERVSYPAVLYCGSAPAPGATRRVARLAGRGARIRNRREGGMGASCLERRGGIADRSTASPAAHRPRHRSTASPVSRNGSAADRQIMVRLG